MRQPADWMTPDDDRILEYLESEGAQSARNISYDERIRLSRRYVNVRLTKLSDTGLVRDVRNGRYKITQVGKLYLDGGLSAREIEVDEPAQSGQNAYM